MVDLGLSVKWATCNLGAVTPRGVWLLLCLGGIRNKDGLFLGEIQVVQGLQYVTYKV